MSFLGEGNNSTIEAGSAGALNADAIAARDVAEFQSGVIQVTGTFSGTLTFQGSNDGTNYVSVLALDATNPSASPQNTTTVPGLFYIPLTFAFFRLRMTSYTSGSADAIALFQKIPSGDLGQRSVGIAVSGALIDPRQIRALTAADVISAAQSGAWSVGRTWTLASGSDSVSAVVTSSALPTGAATEATLATRASEATLATMLTLAGFQARINTLGQKAMTASTPVVLASDQSAIPVTQSGTWTVQQGTPPWSVGGNVASGAADSGNPVKVGGVFNTTLPTLANGQRGDIQLDSSARPIIAPLTNSSVVKAQLQDNAGTAITLGQKAMTASVPVVLASDQAGINTFLNKTGTGTLTALNQTVAAVSNGCSEVVFNLTGTWVGTVVVEGTVDGSNWTTVRGYSSVTETALTFTSINTDLRIPSGGFAQIRARMFAYTSGTVNVAWSASAGNGYTQIFNNTPSALNAQVNLRDGSSNSLTSTAIAGTGSNKQVLDTTSIHAPAGRYSTAFSLQQAAATAANATVFAMRNAAASTRTVIIERIICRMGFNAANPVTRTQQTYIFQRFSAATPTGGTALTAGRADSSDAASQVTDVRFLATGLTTTGVTFDTANLASMACDTTQGINNERSLLLPPSVIRLAPGEGLAIRLGVTAVVGQALNCVIFWREQ